MKERMTCEQMDEIASSLEWNDAKDLIFLIADRQEDYNFAIEVMQDIVEKYSDELEYHRRKRFLLEIKELVK